MGVLDRITASEAVGPGSIPGRAIKRKRGLRVCWNARQISNLQDGVRFLGGLLGESQKNSSLECAGFARDSAKVEDQVQFLARTLIDAPRDNGGDPCSRSTSTISPFFETMSKRRKGFPSETQVKRGVRIVGDDKLLEEKLGRNDLCPCGSNKRLKKCCLKSGRF